MDDSDSDGEKKTKPAEVSKVARKDSSKSKKRRILGSSDEDEPATNGKKESISSKLSKLSTKSSPDGKKKLKPVDVNSVFGNEPVKRIEKEKKTSKTSKASNLFDDFDDDEDLAEIDDDLLSPATSKTSKPSNHKDDKSHIEKVSSKKDADVLKTINKSPSKIKAEKRSPQKKDSDKPKEVIDSEKGKHKLKADEDDDVPTLPSKQKKNGTPASSKKKPAKPKQEEADLDTSVYDADQERHEKRRATAMLYKQFQKRSGPSNPGSKEIPKGKPNCFEKLTFVLTGVYESMERDEAKSVIEELGN